ncbi:MAG: hypothetical protein KDA84_15120 [Planctomycetaceae bacterium]|nr:hypothetical protein [Planctomycetaceae bacterium]
MCRFPWGSLPLLGFVCALVFQPLSASGQMVSSSFPLVGVRDGFSEGIRSNWSLTGPGIYSWFNNNSGSGIPRFGGFQPNAGLNGGFAFNRGAFGANLGFNFSQGSSRSMTSSTPVINGFGGSPLIFQNNLQRPFVTSLIPNVGNGARFQDLGAANTIRGRMLRGEFSMRNGKVIPAGGAKPAEASVAPKKVGNHRPLVDPAPPTRAERRAQEEAQETEQLLAIRKYLQKGKEAEAKGKKSVAKLYYQMAARRADGDLKRQALASIERVTN